MYIFNGRSTMVQLSLIYSQAPTNDAELHRKTASIAFAVTVTGYSYLCYASSVLTRCTYVIEHLKCFSAWLVYSTGYSSASSSQLP